ncbi:MAG: glycosyltransferase family 4 protein [Tannerella sp.]|jgi:glycosyltransferase involved in cell wall biosynthesis|nr:glycosyltransferase family 4 protein [Tannerella sp.]
MTITIINTSEKTGGAAIAAKRLMQALNDNNVSTQMLVLKGSHENKLVSSIVNSNIKNLLARSYFIWERILIFFNNGFSRKNLFRVSLANTGFDISNHPLVRQADILHLHWINQGFLTLKSIESLTKLKKPIIWTLHDMWACTGICHHARDCEKYTTKCHSCFYLNSKTSNDLSTLVFDRKKILFESSGIAFVTCSKWLHEKVKKSELLKNNFSVAIPNPINTQLYNFRDKKDCRAAFRFPTDKFLLLFGAANSTDDRKGLNYFLEALSHIENEVFEQLEIVIFGEMKQEVKQSITMPIHVLGYLSGEEEIIKLYNAVDAFVISSLDENLPNTIMEAMACGTPCIGFNTGGIPEMIDNKHNGYVAKYENAEDLAEGINWVFKEADYKSLSLNAREKVVNNYSQDIVAKKYIKLYETFTG